MRHAIEKSCNVYFYTLGNMLGVDRMHKWATRLGLGVKSGIDLPNEVEGIMPSTEWKRKRNNEKWYAGETISVAIGQGQVSVTPISLAVMMATVANGGTRFAPRLVKAYDDGQGWKDLDAAAGTRDVPVQALHLRRRARRLVDGGQRQRHRRPRAHSRARCLGQDGHGAGHLATGRKAARNSEKDLRDHGWFVFFAPRDNPEIAGVIFAEHAEHGYSAAPIARHMIATYLREEARRAAARVHVARRCRRRLRRRRKCRSSPRRRAGGRSVATQGAGRAGMFERRLYFHLDWLLLAAILVLSVMGIAMIYSATQATTPRLFQQQVYALVLGLVALTVALSIDYRTLADKSHWIYIAVVLLLIYVMFFGVVRGYTRIGYRTDDTHSSSGGTGKKLH